MINNFDKQSLVKNKSLIKEETKLNAYLKQGKRNPKEPGLECLFVNLALNVKVILENKEKIHLYTDNN